jgi:hypothetical protein
MNFSTEAKKHKICDKRTLSRYYVESALQLLRVGRFRSVLVCPDSARQVYQAMRKAAKDRG